MQRRQVHTQGEIDDLPQKDVALWNESYLPLYVCIYVCEFIYMHANLASEDQLRTASCQSKNP